jgi:hypothetical protein
MKPGDPKTHPVRVKMEASAAREIPKSPEPWRAVHVTGSGPASSWRPGTAGWPGVLKLGKPAYRKEHKIAMHVPALLQHSALQSRRSQMFNIIANQDSSR